MIEQQRKQWQIVPPIITGGEIPVIDKAALREQWPIAPPVTTGVHLPAIERAQLTLIPTASQITDTKGQIYHLPSSPSPKRMNREQFQSHSLAQPSPVSISEHQSTYLSQPGLHLAWPEMDMLEKRVKKGKIEKSGTSAFPQSLTSFDGNNDYDERRQFFNQVVQPALEGLMDGSLSSLAPIFLTIFMTRQTLTTFLIGAGAALAGGISETFSESLSDDEDLSERGNPLVHAGITGLFTFISGLIPALPFLIADYRLSLSLAYVVVMLELTIIAMIRSKLLGVKWWLSALQVVGGGALVFMAAVLLGNV